MVGYNPTLVNIKIFYVINQPDSSTQAPEFYFPCFLRTQRRSLRTLR